MSYLELNYSVDFTDCKLDKAYKDAFDWAYSMVGDSCIGFIRLELQSTCSKKDGEYEERWAVFNATIQVNED